MSEKEKIGKNLEQLVRLSLLYDFYGALIKDHKRQIFEDYVLNDYSLGEIAKAENMTRQGIYDIVKRCSRELEQYEEKLGLVRRFDEVGKRVEKIREAAENLLLEDENYKANRENLQDKLKYIEELSDEILEELWLGMD